MMLLSMLAIAADGTTAGAMGVVALAALGLVGSMFNAHNKAMKDEHQAQTEERRLQSEAHRTERLQLTTALETQTAAFKNLYDMFTLFVREGGGK